MKSPVDFICAALFFGATAFLSGLIGFTNACILAVIGTVISLLLSLFIASEKNRYHRMRRDIGDRQERESLRLASGPPQGSEWDSGKGGPNER